MPHFITSSDIHGNEYQIKPSQLSWRPAAYAIVVRDGHILLTTQHQKFHLPGGGVEFGEMPEEAAIREAREETGFIVGNPRLVDMVSGYFSYHSHSAGKKKHVQSILLYYHCDFVGGEASIDGFEESERAIGDMPQWVSLDRLDMIKAGSTIDWRAIVKRTLK